MAEEPIPRGGFLAITRCHEGGVGRNLVDLFPHTCFCKSCRENMTRQFKQAEKTNPNQEVRAGMFFFQLPYVYIHIYIYVYIIYTYIYIYI